MRAQDIKLIGTTYDTDCDNKKWWDYEKEQQKFIESIEKKNANILKPVFEAMVKQGVDSFEAPFSGGGDCGGFDGNIIFFNEKGKEISIDYNKLKPDGWKTNYIPLIHKTPTKTKGVSTCNIFEYEYTDYANFDITEDWLVQRLYEFGFLNEWGSFAFEGHVSGTVKIYPKTGKYEMPYDQSVEEYDSHEEKGVMFDEKGIATNIKESY